MSFEFYVSDRTDFDGERWVHRACFFLFFFLVRNVCTCFVCVTAYRGVATTWRSPARGAVRPSLAGLPSQAISASACRPFVSVLALFCFFVAYLSVS